jgi:hypothetical protein
MEIMMDLKFENINSIKATGADSTEYEGMKDTPVLDLLRIITYVTLTFMLIIFGPKGTIIYSAYIFISLAFVLFTVVWFLGVISKIITISKIPVMWYLFPIIDTLAIIFFLTFFGGIHSVLIIAFPVLAAQGGPENRNSFRTCSSRSDWPETVCI